MLVSRDDLLNKISRIFPFNLSNNETLKTLVEKSEVVFFDAGKLVYMEGASAENFYIIYEGLIEIYVEERQSIRKLNTLNDGDYFGEDALRQNNSIRTSSARVMKDALLIKIPKILLEKIIRDDPSLESAFSIISNTYLRLFEKKFKNLSGESIYFIGNPHYLAFFSKIVFSLFIFLIPVFAIFFLASNNILSGSLLLGAGMLIALLLLLRIIWHLYEWRNNYYVMTGKRVINLKRNLANFESKFDIPLAAINNLEVSKNILGRQMNFGDLIIRTFTGETILKNVPFTPVVQAFLELLVAKENISKRQDQRKSFERIIGTSLSSGRQTADFVEQQAQVLENPVDEDDSFSKTVYLTHWIILLRKVLFPSLLILSIVLLLTFFSANNIQLMDSITGISLTGILLFGAFFWWLFQFFDWRNDQYHITADQIIDIYRRPFGTENRRTASILNIQSVRFERKGILGLLLNFGTVYIRVGDEEFTFDNVPDPAGIQEQLFGFLEKSIAHVKKSEITEQQKNLVEWMDAYHQVREKKSGES